MRGVRVQFRRWIVAVAAGLVVALACGCDRGQTRSDSGGARESDSASELDDAIGEACEGDRECPRYLRCLDATCEEPPAMSGESDAETPAVAFYEDVDAAEAESVAQFHVELATTPEARRTGLMYRPSMQSGWGMLFVYPDEAERSFWMKNTLIPLDMVFVDAAGEVVSILEGAEPETLVARRSEGPARYVLEVNAGAAEEAGLAAGMQMRLEDVPDQYLPEQ